MSNERVDPDGFTTTGGGSCALQGCLYGAVGLFVVMLIVILFLAYRQFRDNTQSAEPPSPAAMSVEPPSRPQPSSRPRVEGFQLLPTDVRSVIATARHRAAPTVYRQVPARSPDPLLLRSRRELRSFYGTDHAGLHG